MERETEETERAHKPERGTERERENKKPYPRASFSILLISDQ